VIASPAIHIGHGVIEFPPAIVAHVAYVAQDSGYLSAVRTTDGTKVWQVRIAHAADSPAVAHGRVFVDTSAGLTAVAVASGKLLWRRQIAAGESKPTIIGTHVCVGAKVGGVFCFGQYGGRLIRHLADGCKITGHVAYVGGSFYWDDYCGNVTRAGPHRVLWTRHVGRVFYTAPVVSQGVVYLGDRDGGAYLAVSADTGARLWRTYVGPDVYGTPAVTAGAVYGTYRGTTAGGGFIKLNRVTGAILWRRAVGVPVMASPIVTGHRAWFATAPPNYAPGVILAFDVNGMHPAFTFGSDGRYTPLAVDGTDAVLVGRQDLYVMPGQAT